MPQYRADFDVNGTIVFSVGSAPLVITNDKFAITIKNADVDDQGNTSPFPC